MDDKFSRARFACYVGYVTQAVVNNFMPLLFVTFQTEFSISAARISLLIAANFVTQILIDFFSAPIVSLLGCRKTLLLGCAFTTVGLVSMSFLPSVINPFAALLFCSVLCAVGGGVMEVLVSPIIESCPSENKAGQMNLLHSFYCWGSAFCILASTVFFALFSTSHWRILALLWAIIPLADIFLFLKAPLNPIDDERSGGYKQLFFSGVFWLMLFMMMCSGASELAVSQWSSSFAESALGVKKSIGDIAGPFAFAIFMGTARALSVKITDKHLTKAMAASSALCILGYALICLPDSALLSLIGCSVCGFSVAIMWPGTFSIAAKRIPKGGTAMFSLLALAGDVGCTAGPVTVGLSDNLSDGFMLAALFPIAMLICTLICSRNKKDAL